MQISRYRGAVLAFFVGVLIIGIPLSLINGQFASPGEPITNITVGLIQLVALYFPALMILMQILLDYSHKKEEKSGLSGGVGPFSANTFRWAVFATGLASSFLLSIGLIFLFLSLDVPLPVEIAALLIVIAILYAPFLLALMTYLLWQEAHG